MAGLFSQMIPPIGRRLAFPPVVQDWVNKGLGMSSCVCVTGHIKDPLPLIEKSRALCPGGGVPPSFIHHSSNHYHHQTE